MMVPPLIARVVGVKSYISSYSWFESVIHHKKYKPYKSKKYMRRLKHVSSLYFINFFKFV